MLKEYESNPTIGNAQAQCKAMMGLINMPARRDYVNPLFWVPFIVTEKGGYGATPKQNHPN
jgi:hypothetical protein